MRETTISTRSSRQRTTSARTTKSENTNKSETRLIIGSVDFIILFVVVLLIIIGTIMIFSASYYSAGNSESFNNDIYYFLKRHLRYLPVGLVIMIFLCNFNYKYIKPFTFTAYCISVVCLVLVLFFGREINGAKRWLWFFQPSEVAKLALILYLASYIDDNKGILNDPRGFVRCIGIILLPTALIALENLSTAVVTFAIGMGILFIGTPNKRFFLPFIPLGGIGLVGGIALASFRIERIYAWLDPFEYAMDKGYQAVQSFYAIASGGFLGLGLGHSRQKLGYIPEAHNDIIFSILCEEMGFFGAAIVIILFMILIWRVVRCAMLADSEFGILAAGGIIVMIGIQVIMNIAVVTNTMPNTGIPLPFISYGGTSLIVMLTAMGIVLNISKYQKIR
ncbi:MAG: putative lipid II flippase FtsW [Clostridiales bacterium]|nr:putative lipid II flippase FtsW [Clostridiales bacterium]